MNKSVMQVYFDISTTVHELSLIIFISVPVIWYILHKLLHVNNVISMRYNSFWSHMLKHTTSRVNFKMKEAMCKFYFFKYFQTFD